MLQAINDILVNIIFNVFLVTLTVLASPKEGDNENFRSAFVSIFASVVTSAIFRPNSNWIFLIFPVYYIIYGGLIRRKDIPTINRLIVGYFLTTIILLPFILFIFFKCN